MFRITSRLCCHLVSIAVVVIVLICIFLPGFTAADNHKKRFGNNKTHENSEYRLGNRNNADNHENNGDEGNETTGQIAAWLLVGANLTIVLSIVSKAMMRYFPFEFKTKSFIKKFNQGQKKQLMRFHYILNPVALCIAGIHFSLSSCHSSPLPEWGLICLAVMVFFGFTVKLRLAPKRIQLFVFRLHTGLASISVIIVLLVAGHMIVD